MMLIYNGALSPDTTRSIMDVMRSYPSVMEMTDMPPSSRVNELFSHLTWVHEGEDCMGQRTITTRAGIPLACVHKEDGSGVFVFMKSEETRKWIAEEFPEMVINEKPFQTGFDWRD